MLTAIGMVIMPIGLLMFGWTAQAETHWIGPQISQAVTCYGLMLAFNSIQVSLHARLRADSRTLSSTRSIRTQRPRRPAPPS